MSGISLASSAASLFVRRSKDSVADTKRMHLLKERAALCATLRALGTSDEALDIKRGLEGALRTFVADPVDVKELQALVEKLKPIRHYIRTAQGESSGDAADVLGSIEKLRSKLSSERSAHLISLLERLKNIFTLLQKQLEGDNRAALTKKYNCSIIGLTVSYRYIAAEAMAKMLPLGSDGHILKSMKAGSTPVNRDDQDMYWKKSPPATLYQSGWDAFEQHFAGLSSAASQLVVCQRDDKTYYTQASAAIDGGISMLQFITEQSHLLPKLDRVLFGKTAILHMVGLTEDASEHNYMMFLEKDTDGNVVLVRWKGFDGDRWGVHPIVLSSGGKHRINMRSIFLCLKQIYEQIDAEVRDYYRNKNPAKETLEYLREMSILNEQLMVLLRQVGIPQKKLDKLSFPFMLLEEQINKIYRDFCAIRKFMRSPYNDDKTYMDLWQEIIDTMTAHFYDMMNKRYPNDPYAAFIKIMYQGGPDVEDVMSGMMDNQVFSDSKETVAENLKKQHHHVYDWLTRRNTLPNKGAEQLLQNEINFAEYTLEEQEEILEVLQRFPLSEITLRNCAITDTRLMALLAGQPFLKKLQLIRCENLTDLSVQNLFNLKPDLELTLSDCNGFTKKTLTELGRGFKIHVRDRRFTIFVPASAEPAEGVKGFLDQSRRGLTGALESGDWTEIKKRYASMQTAGQGAQAVTKIFEHMLKTDQMRQIVKDNKIEALEFLLTLNFKISQKNIKDETLYHLCCEMGNARMLQWLSDRTLNWAEIVDQRGATPCHVAVTHNQLDCLKALKKANAPMSSPDPMRVTPLRLALENGKKNPEIAEYLITEAKVTLEETNLYKQTPLHLACQKGLSDLALAILRRAPLLVNQPDKFGRVPLYDAIEAGHDDCFNHLLACMQDVNIADDKGRTPLMLAAQFNREKMVDALIKKSANLQTRDQEKMNAVQIAALAGSLECLQLLIKQNAEGLSEVREDKKTLIHLAVLSGNKKCVEWLFRKDLLKAMDTEGLTPAHLAALKGHWDILKFLIESGFPIDFQDNPRGETCLMLAFRAHQFDLADNLIASHASVEVIKGDNGQLRPLVDKRKLYIIHRAAIEGDSVQLRQLVGKYKMNVHKQAENTEKAQPIYLAAARGHKQAVETLIELGADPDAKTPDKKTPSFIAVQNGHGPVLETLVQHNANLKQRKSDGSSLLHFAVLYGRPELAIYILSLQPILIHVRTEEDGHTPLHRAMYQEIIDNNTPGTDAEKEQMLQKQYKIVEILLRSGADVNATDDHGFVPLHLAVKYGRSDFVSLLLQRGARVDCVNKHGRTPEAHGIEMASGNLKNAILAACKLLHEHTKMPAQRVLLFGNEKSAAALKQQSLQARQKNAIELLKKDKGFRPETILALRSIENTQAQAVDVASFATEVSGLIVSELKAALPRGWEHHPWPLALQKFDQQWITALNLANREELLCALLLAAKPVEMLQLIDKLNDEQFKTAIAFLNLCKGHETFVSADFPSEICRSIRNKLKKVKKVETKELREFLENPELIFPKWLPDHSWKSGDQRNIRSRLLPVLEKRAEDTASQFTLTLMGKHKEWLLKVRLSDFRTFTEAGKAATALMELLQTGTQLSGNSLIYLLQAQAIKYLTKRLEFVIGWIHTSLLYGDFHQAFALYKAVTHPAVVRIQEAFKELKKPTRAQLLQFEQLFSPANNYQNYFSCLKERLSPSIPAISIYFQLLGSPMPIELRYSLLRQFQELRAFSNLLNLPAVAASTESLLCLTADLYDRTDEAFAWERSQQLKPPKVKRPQNK